MRLSTIALDWWCVRTTGSPPHRAEARIVMGQAATLVGEKGRAARTKVRLLADGQLGQSVDGSTAACGHRWSSPTRTCTRLDDNHEPRHQPASPLGGPPSIIGT